MRANDARQQRQLLIEQSGVDKMELVFHRCICGKNHDHRPLGEAPTAGDRKDFIFWCAGAEVGLITEVENIIRLVDEDQK